MIDLRDLRSLDGIPPEEVLEFLEGEDVYIHADIAVRITNIDVDKQEGLYLANGFGYKRSHPYVKSDPALLCYVSNLSFYGQLCGIANRFWNRNPGLWEMK